MTLKNHCQGVTSAALLVLAGCAPAKLLHNPPGWPEQWGPRQLYTTPHVRLYARTEPAAGEIDRLVAAVAQDYEHDAGAPGPAPLIIISDQGDPEWIDNADDLLRETTRSEAAFKGEAADEQEKAAEKIAEARKSAAEAGVDLKVMLSFTPLLCDRQTLRQMLNAPDAVIENTDAALIVPTRALIDRNTHRLIRGALEKQGVGPVAQVAFAPLLALVEAKSADLVALSRDVAVYEYWVFTNPRWNHDQRQQHAEAYRRLKLGALADQPETAGKRDRAAGDAAPAN